MHGTTADEQAILVAVSTVIFALLPDRDGATRVHLPLVRRTRAPFLHRWALPGGWVRTRESLGDAGRRTLAETTGLRPSYLEQLYTFGEPDRSGGRAGGDGRRVVSVVYSALVRSHEVGASAPSGDPHSDGIAHSEGIADNVRWAAADDATELAFDHDAIVRYALWRLRTKVQHAHVAQHFLGERFSLAALREVHEAVLQRPLDPANFRRQVESSGTVVATGEHQTGGRHRPPKLYRALVPEGSTGPLS